MTRAMAVRNKIKPLVDGLGKTRYQFWKDIGVAQNTAYSLYNDPSQIPTAAVMDKICAAYGVQPGDFIIHIPDKDLKAS